MQAEQAAARSHRAAMHTSNQRSAERAPATRGGVALHLAFSSSQHQESAGNTLEGVRFYFFLSETLPLCFSLAVSPTLADPLLFLLRLLFLLQVVKDFFQVFQFAQICSTNPLYLNRHVI